MNKLLISSIVFFHNAKQGLLSRPPHHERHMIIMRHGQGQHNVDQVYNSNPQHPNYKPSPLTKMGKEQVQESARKLLADGFTPLNIETIIVSPLQRAQETAEALVEAGLIRRDLIQTDARLGVPPLRDT